VDEDDAEVWLVKLLKNLNGKRRRVADGSYTYSTFASGGLWSGVPSPAFSAMLQSREEMDQSTVPYCLVVVSR